MTSSSSSSPSSSSSRRIRRRRPKTPSPAINNYNDEASSSSSASYIDDASSSSSSSSDSSSSTPTSSGITIDSIAALWRPRFEQWYHDKAADKSSSVEFFKCPMCGKGLKLSSIPGHLRNNYCGTMKLIPVGLRGLVYDLWKDSKLPLKSTSSSDSPIQEHEISPAEECALRIVKLVGFRFSPRLQWKCLCRD